MKIGRKIFEDCSNIMSGRKIRQTKFSYFSNNFALELNLLNEINCSQSTRQTNSVNDIINEQFHIDLNFTHFGTSLNELLSVWATLLAGSSSQSASLSWNCLKMFIPIVFSFQLPLLEWRATVRRFLILKILFISFRCDKSGWFLFSERLQRRLPVMKC